MERPLESGDKCVVIGGLGNNKSPNLGKIITVDKRVYGAHGMNHGRFGPIYKCIGEGLYQLGDAGEYVLVASADFAGIWLKRIDPTKLKKQLEKVLEEDLED